VTRRPVTVVVPVYNGHDALRRCLETLSEHTPGDDVSILLADDASSDDRVPALLAAAAAADPRITVVRRDRNVGFTANCNRAIVEAGDDDVVLLNSDTIVPAGWLERMRALAATSDRIGSITPLSNNAEIAGAPHWLTANTFPEGIDVEMLDDIARTVGTGEWIELPTSVGFCVYLSRKALDAVGLFDEERFGAGYGEENDLSLRMRNDGYLNLLCDTVYVWHEGGVSFAESGTGDRAANLERLAEVWPTYHDLIREFIARNPLWAVQSRFGLELLRRTKRTDRRRALFITHHPLWSGYVGGTEMHAEDLIETLGARIDPVVLSFDDDGSALVQWKPQDAVLSFPVDLAAVSTRPERWVDLLLDTGVDLVHIHHAMRAPLDLVRALLDLTDHREVPVAWTLHDYFTLCPTATLLDAESGAPCTSLEAGPACLGCEQQAKRLAGTPVAEWRSEWAELLSWADRVFSPSQAAADLVARYVPGTADRITVQPHGIAPGPEPAPREPGRNVVVLGYGGTHKGDTALAGVIEALSGRGIRWHLFGRKRLSVDDRSDVVVHGPYDRADLPRLLDEAGIDAALLLSPWPETYSYTLSESWRQGIPVFGSGLGAIGERIAAEGGGVVVDPFDPKAAAATIAAVLGDPDEMRRLAAQAREAGRRVLTLEEMAAAYDEHYRTMAPAIRPARPTPFPVEPDELEIAGWLGSFRSPVPE